MVIYEFNDISIYKGNYNAKRGLELFQDYNNFDINKSSLIVVNSDIVGFYNVTLLEAQDSISLEYQMLDIFKNIENETKCLDLLSMHLCKKNKDFAKVLLLTKTDDENSIMVARKAGFHVDPTLQEEIELRGEMSEFVPLIQYNVLCIENEANHLILV